MEADKQEQLKASLFLQRVHIHRCTFIPSSLCFLMHTNTHLCFFAHSPTSPTPLARPGHQSAFPPRRRCDRGAVRASQSAAVMLSRSDRATGGKRAKQTASNIRPVLSLPDLCQSRGVLTEWEKPQKHKYSPHTAVCIVIGSFHRSPSSDFQQLLLHKDSQSRGFHV